MCTSVLTCMPREGLAHTGGRAAGAGYTADSSRGSNLRPACLMRLRRAVNAAQHKVVNFLRT